MPYYSDEDITKVREATDLIQLIGERVALKQRGRQWWGCCPFHNEKTPSFKVDPASGLWHCFGCGEGGDAFGYVMRTESMDFGEAVLFLAERAHITLTVDARASARKAQSDVLRAVCAETARWYNEQLLRVKGPAQDAARAYLGRRGFGTGIADKWQLGYAPGRGELFAHLKAKGHKLADMVAVNVVTDYRGNPRDRFFERVIFPITDLQGRVVAFGGRVVEGLTAAPGAGMPTAKYLNSNDNPLFHKSDHLYGIYQARRSIVEHSCALVVEGYTDVIALHEAGLTYTVATLGTALNAHQVRLLARFAKRIVYVFDGDEAGQRAADRAVEFIDQTVMPEFASDPLQLDVVVIPGGADPAELVATSDGQQQMLSLIDEARPLFEFALDRRLARWDLDRPEQRQRALRDAVEVIASLQGSLLGSEYAQILADKLAAAGSPVELRQVLIELEAAAQRREKRQRTTTTANDEDEGIYQQESDGVGREGQPDIERQQAQNVAATLAAPLDPGASAEQDLLALFLFKPALRAALWAEFSPDLFTVVAYHKLASALCSHDPATPQKTLEFELLKDFPTLPLLYARYDSIIKDEFALEDRAQSLIQHLHEAQLQSEITSLKAQMRTSKDSDALLDKLIGQERELQKLRAKRYR